MRHVRRRLPPNNAMPHAGLATRLPLCRGVFAAGDIHRRVPAQFFPRERPTIFNSRTPRFEKEKCLYGQRKKTYPIGRNRSGDWAPIPRNRSLRGWPRKSRSRRKTNNRRRTSSRSRQCCRRWALRRSRAVPNPANATTTDSQRLHQLGRNARCAGAALQHNRAILLDYGGNNGMALCAGRSAFNCQRVGIVRNPAVAPC